MDDANGAVRVDSDVYAIIPQYFQNIREEVAELGEQGDSAFFENATIFGHSLKGTGAAFGFPLLTEKGKALEKIAKSGDLHGTRDLLEQILSYIETVSYVAE